MKRDRQQLGLVKAALALPGRMQGDRHDEIETAAGEPRIFEGIRQPVGELMAEMDFAIVLKIMNQLTDHRTTSVGGNSGVEMQGAIRAVCADKGTRDVAREGL
jgi:hypothetical protein